jgi:hypothetical protein
VLHSTRLQTKAVLYVNVAKASAFSWNMEENQQLQDKVTLISIVINLKCEC